MLAGQKARLRSYDRPAPLRKVAGPQFNPSRCVVCQKSPKLHAPSFVRRNAVKSVAGIPEGMHSLTPYLVCAGAADAIEFYKQAFDAEELTVVWQAINVETRQLTVADRVER